MKTVSEEICQLLKSQQYNRNDNRDAQRLWIKLIQRMKKDQNLDLKAQKKATARDKPKYHFRTSPKCKHYLTLTKLSRQRLFKVKKLQYKERNY